MTTKVHEVRVYTAPPKATRYHRGSRHDAPAQADAPTPQPPQAQSDAPGDTSRTESPTGS